MSVSSRLNRSDKAGSRPHQRLAWAAWASGILWALAGFGLAHAQPPTCTPALKNSPASVQINYDPFLAGATPTHLTFQLVNQIHQDAMLFRVLLILFLYMIKLFFQWFECILVFLRFQ